MDYSVVIPLFNERDSVVPLHVELTRAMAATGRAYELLFVDDGSTDDSLDVLRQIKSQDQNVRVIRLARNSGQTAALACGFANAKGDVVIAMDADGQNDPADIPPTRHVSIRSTAGNMDETEHPENRSMRLRARRPALPEVKVTASGETVR